MTAEPRAALDRLIAALEAHLHAVSRRRGENDPAVVAAFDTLADAFSAYDDALFSAYEETTPFVLYDDDDEDEDLDDDDLDEEGDDDEDDDEDEDEDIDEDEDLDDDLDEEGDDAFEADSLTDDDVGGVDEAEGDARGDHSDTPYAVDAELGPAAAGNHRPQ